MPGGTTQDVCQEAPQDLETQLPASSSSLGVGKTGQVLLPDLLCGLGRLT